MLKRQPLNTYQICFGYTHSLVRTQFHSGTMTTPTKKKFQFSLAQYNTETKWLQTLWKHTPFIYELKCEWFQNILCFLPLRLKFFILLFLKCGDFVQILQISAKLSLNFKIWNGPLIFHVRKLIYSIFGITSIFGTRFITNCSTVKDFVLVIKWDEDAERVSGKISFTLTVFQSRLN